MNRDEGLNFVTTIRKPSGEALHLETGDRVLLLAWLDVQMAPGDVVSVSMEATGPAVPKMIAALRFGAQQLQGEKD